ncbi:disease resistance protein [Striga asiatica]|uniref:Disease resistance protein n=1 Tax=Striga asiatica TaxID=4170 RepID=A0A5A7P5F3_STRAF|nr:disease resistance protein [Striga asiatica]
MEDCDNYCLGNLCRLHKLEEFACIIDWNWKKSEVARDLMITFLISLRKLILKGTCYNAVVGPEWETVDGGFPSLKYLEINWNSDLEEWRTEATHFPCLEQLRLLKLLKLVEIPLGIGDIPTLKEINMVFSLQKDCYIPTENPMEIYSNGNFNEYSNDSVVLSAKKILEEQEKCHGEVGLQITIF